MKRLFIGNTRILVLRLLLLAIANTLFPTLNAQLLTRDYLYIKRSDAWLTSGNAAPLTRFQSQDISLAELSLTSEKGGFVNYYQSGNALQTNISTEAYYRLSPRTVLYGAIRYNNFSGKDMAGSAFMYLPTLLSPLSTLRPSPSAHYPFDIVEDSLGNEGTKHRDVYHLEGGFGVEVVKGLSLGARLDYTAANYAKYKDLRHKNKLMDLSITAGFYAPLGQWGAIGANYLYHRNTESLQFSTYGKGDKVYQSLISYAAFMGQREQFGSEGFTDKSREMPLVNDCSGVGVQFSFHSLPDARHPAPITLHFFNDFTYARRLGYYGRKSPYTITYTDHHSHLYDYRACLSLLSRKSRFSLDFFLNAENLQNDANTFREQQNDAGASRYEYYATVKMANKIWVDGSVAMTADLAVNDELPLWTLQAGLNWKHRKQTAYLYPFYRHQELSSNEIFANATRNVLCRRSVWTFSLGGGFLWGWGEPFEDHSFATPSEKMSAPATMDTWLYQEHQWLTAAQYHLMGSVKYAFTMPETSIKPHVSIGLQHRKTNNPNEYSRGQDHTQVSVALGCTF